MIRWLFLVILAFAAPATADELRPGYLEFTQESAAVWRLVWKAPLRGGITASTQPLLPAGCTLERPTYERLAQAVISRWRVTCVRPVGGDRIGLANFVGSNDVLVRVAPLGQPVQALRLTPDAPIAVIAKRADRWQVAQAYFLSGIEHILFGFDHLLFVLCLVLLLADVWRIAAAVTAFTIAHSITLVASTLGVIVLPQRAVEATIALSIVFLAVEIVKQSDGAPRLSERAPWVVAFLFGLLHGFGFASALAEIGLPEGEVPMALFAFNLGVEAGQLGIVIGGFAVLELLRRMAASLLAPALRLAAYVIGITASYWIIERTLA
jgi:hydrogenase/urease accessory protein HupE